MAAAQSADDKAQAAREQAAAAEEKARQAKADAAASEKGDEPEERTYSVDRLTDSSEALLLTGHDVPTVEGALTLLPGNKKHFTLAEIGAAIDDFNDHAEVVDNDDRGGQA